MGLYSKIIDLQKLNMAWDRVKRNKPSSGVDHVTYEDFENQKREELKQLNLELAEHRYAPHPVRMAEMLKDEKIRTISLFCMRDKVVQQSLASELGKIYEPLMSKSVFAYRPGMSALQALDLIAQKVSAEEPLWVLKLDIADFFDSILHEQMLRILGSRIKEQDVLELVKKILQTPIMNAKTGDTEANRRGILQGSTCAPILSNIYLMEYDREMEQSCGFYVRYSDDILVLEKSFELAVKAMNFTKTYFEGLGLQLKESKTLLQKVDDKEGFQFLGYHFDRAGKTIPAKAEASLTGRLEAMWFTKGLTTDDKIKKGQEILGGWEQYYRDDRKPGSMIEYVILLSMVRYKGEGNYKALESHRFEYTNDYKDILVYMTEYWRQRGLVTNELREYEQFYQVPEEQGADSAGHEKLLNELLERYRKIVISPEEELYTDIMQLYTDLGEYKKAAHFWELRSKLEPSAAISVPVDNEAQPADEKAANLKLQTYFNLFVGREDVYVKEVPSGSNNRESQTVLQPLTEDNVKRHLEGKEILDTYVQRQNATAKYVVFDVDISKKALLNTPYGSEEFKSHKLDAGKAAAQICGILKKIGLKGYVEDSGYRGYHIWVFFEEWIPVRFINLLTEYVQSQWTEQDGNLTLEFFPNHVRVKPGKYGQCIKLPLGIHIKTGNRSFFLDEDMEPVRDYGEYFDRVAKYSQTVLHRILGSFISNNETNICEQTKTVDENLEEFGPLNDSVRIVLQKCSLMRYLCQKARTTGYLTHAERLSVLYVFAHMGEEGKNFVHTVMAFTVNYQYGTTQRFIVKLPEKPISCTKLREQYKMITAEYGCSCNFRRTKNCYPSPVLHAIKNSEEDNPQITVPIGRTITRSKEEKVYEEINIHKQAEKLAQRMVELKRQKRGIDKSIRKLEEEMQRLFDNAGTDCLEVEMGLLVRRKKGEGYEWLIEI